ncbi:hypothetical protein D3C75_728310 [compost metagenome]
MLCTEAELSTGLWNAAQVGTLRLVITQSREQVGLDAHRIKLRNAQARLQAIGPVFPLLHAKLNILCFLLLVVEVNINAISPRSLSCPLFKHRQVGLALLWIVQFQQCWVKIITSLRTKRYSAHQGELCRNEIRQSANAWRRPIPGLDFLVTHPYCSMYLQGDPATLDPYPH